MKAHFPFRTILTTAACGCMLLLSSCDSSPPTTPPRVEELPSQRHQMGNGYVPSMDHNGAVSVSSDPARNK